MTFLDVKCPVCGHARNLTQYPQDRSVFFQCRECQEDVMVTIDVGPVRSVDAKLPAVSVSMTSLGSEILNCLIDLHGSVKQINGRLRRLEREWLRDHREFQADILPQEELFFAGEPANGNDPGTLMDGDDQGGQDGNA